MKRPNRRRPLHAQPPQASMTKTALLIIAIIILTALIIWVICASHKIAGGAKGVTPKVAASSTPASGSPLGGDDGKLTERKLTSRVTTHILHDEPLLYETAEGCGDGHDEPVSLYGIPVSSATSPVAAPQQRDRPAIEAMQSAVVEAQQARERRIAVWRIDTYLAHKNSPMQGCGEYYIQNQERTGIPGSLSAGIAEAESTNGMRTYNSHTKACPGESYNAWGMISSRFYGGFGSWENGIRANFDWLMEWHSHGGTQPPQTIHDCNGYCEGNTTSQTVDDVQWQINAYEPPEGI